jgi:hypothetical protein
MPEPGRAIVARKETGDAPSCAESATSFLEAVALLIIALAEAGRLPK